MGNWIPGERSGTPHLSSLPRATLRGLSMLFINSRPQGTRQAQGCMCTCAWTLPSVPECMGTGVLMHTCMHAQVCGHGPACTRV